jgi:hypothetical protein
MQGHEQVVAAPGADGPARDLGDLDQLDVPGMLLSAVEERLPSVPESVPVVLLTEAIHEIHRKLTDG